MHGRRKIIFADECHLSAAKLGGYEAIDDALTSGIYDALDRYPWGFPSVESDWYSARYIVTKPFRQTCALLWVFVIDSSGDVIIKHVEEYENYR